MMTRSEIYDAFVDAQLEGRAAAERALRDGLLICAHCGLPIMPRTEQYDGVGRVLHIGCWVYGAQFAPVADDDEDVPF